MYEKDLGWKDGKPVSAKEEMKKYDTGGEEKQKGKPVFNAFPPAPGMPGMGGQPGMMPGMMPGYPGMQPGYPGMQPGYPGMQPGYQQGFDPRMYPAMYPPGYGAMPYPMPMGMAAPPGPKRTKGPTQALVEGIISLVCVVLIFADFIYLINAAYYNDFAPLCCLGMLGLWATSLSCSVIGIITAAVALNSISKGRALPDSKAKPALFICIASGVLFVLVNAFIIFGMGSL